MKIFDNPGKKIKALTSVLFVIGIVLTAIFALFIWLAAALSGGFLLGFFIALFSAAILLISLWISLLILNAFGEISEDVRKQRELLERLENKLSPSEL